jgi:hypothetical protein
MHVGSEVAWAYARVLTFDCPHVENLVYRRSRGPPVIIKSLSASSIGIVILRL